MIDILLATYNGEKYLDLQIFSLVNQTYRDWCLYIHDDGSTDKTVEVIKKWVEKDSRIKFIDDDVKHLGPGNNFIHLIPFVKNEFVCFCDQDDFWFENKLEKYVEKMSKMDNSIPQCKLFSAYVWNTNKITPLINEYSPNLSSLLFTGGTQGCSMVFNRRLVDYLLPFVGKNIYLHDYLIAFVATLFGTYGYEIDKLMLYRQHSNNVTGHLPKSKTEKILKSIFAHKNESFIYPKIYDDIVTIYGVLGNKISIKDRKSIQDYLDLPNYKKFKRFVRILFSKYKIGKHSHFYFVIKYLLRKNYI